MAYRDVKYTDRDFSDLKSSLVELAKNYFPNTVKDFSSASPSTMFLEMSAYVGDVLSYYTDYSLKESMLHKAQEKKNIYSLAQAFGYKPNISTPSLTELTVYIKIPSTGVGANVKPDFEYAPRIEKGLEATTAGSINFRTIESVDFNTSSSNDPTTIDVFNFDANGNPEFYLLSKKVPAISGQRKTYSFNVGASREYLSLTLPDDDIQSIVSVTDDDSNDWNEVPFLGQETIFDEFVNSEANDPELAADQGDVPYILKLKKVNRRFATRVTANDKLQLRFGAGISNDPDESIIPNPSNVGAPFGDQSDGILNKAFDPSNFLYTNTYGLAPANTTLNVSYITGYGLDANVQSNTINTINSKNVTFRSDVNLISNTRTAVENSITCNNLIAASGGKGAETVEQVRQNTLAYHTTQNRMVTKEDYIIRSLSLPSKFGSVAKAYVAGDEQMIDSEKSVDNPLAVNLYTLTYNNEGNLTTMTNAAKRNLKTYLSQYRMLTDAINIKDGFVVNIGIDFDITVLPNNNSKEVLLRCIDAFKTEFNTDNMSFYSSIILKDLYVMLASVKGVQSVLDIKIYNKFGTNYSSNRYNIETATYNEVIYPSLDPSVFEIKFPDTDIKGKVSTY